MCFQVWWPHSGRRKVTLGNYSPMSIWGLWCSVHVYTNRHTNITTNKYKNNNNKNRLKESNRGWDVGTWVHPCGSILWGVCSWGVLGGRTEEKVLEGKWRDPVIQWVVMGTWGDSQLFRLRFFVLSGKYHDVSERTHWTPFLNASVHYIRENYPLPWEKVGVPSSAHCCTDKHCWIPSTWHLWSPDWDS